MLDLTCWSLTEGFAGMESQCVGLAEALGLPCTMKRVRRPRMLLQYLPPTLWPNPLSGNAGDVLAPPWPDVLISSGRGSVAAALAVRRTSGGKIFTVHIQTPYVILRTLMWSSYLSTIHCAAITFWLRGQLCTV